MKGGKTRRLRLLLHVDASQRISRGTTAGVLRYAAVHPDVEVRLYGPGTAAERMEEFADWRPDGLIVGKVVELGFNSYDASRYAVVEPYEDIKSITSAAVITDFSGKGEVRK